MGDLSDYLKSQNLGGEGTVIPIPSSLPKTNQPSFSEYNKTLVDTLKPIDLEADSNYSALDQERNDLRAAQQGNFSKIGNTIGQGVGTFLTATASSMATIGGAIAGASAEIVTGGEADGMDIMLNNPIMKGISDIDKSIKEDLLPTYYSQEQQNSILSAATATDGINGLGFLLSAILPGAAVTKALGGVSKIGQLAKLGKLEQVADKAVKMGTMKTNEAAKLIAYGNVMKNVPPVTGAIVGRLGESAMEANGTYDQLISQGVSEEEAKKQRDNVFYGNMALAASDLAQFTRWFKPNAYERIIKQGLTHTIKKEGAKKLIGEGIKESLQEAGEEGFQYVLGEAAKRDAVDSGDNFIADILSSAGNAFTTIEGQKSMLLGAILGGGAGAAFKTINKKDINAQLNEGVTELNANPSYSNNRYILNSEGQRVINPEFIKNNAQLGRLETLKEQAIAEGDQETADLMDKLAFSSLVNSRVQTNKFDDLIEELENLGEADDTEMEQYFGKSAEGKTAKQISQEKIAEAKELKKMIDGINLIPNFQGISIQGKNIIAETLLTQDAINKQINETVNKMSAIVPQRNWQENLEGEAVEANINYKGLNPVQRAELKNLETTKNELVKRYNHINSTLEKYTTDPKKVDIKIKTQQEKENKQFEAEIEKEIVKDNKAEKKVSSIKTQAENGPVTVETPEGPIEVISVDGTLMNNATGEIVTDEEIKEGVVAEQELVEDAEIVDEETPSDNEGNENVTFEHNENDVDFNYQKASTLTSSISTHEIKRGKKQETEENGSLIWKFNEKFRQLGAYVGKIANSPFVSTVSGGNSPVFTFKVEDGLLDITLAELNSNRIAINERHALNGTPLEIKLLTEEDLLTPEFKTIRMILYKDGRPVPGETNLHYADYFFNTGEYEKLVQENYKGKITPEELYETSLQRIAEYNKYRADLVNQMASGKPIFIKTGNKSKGVPNFMPKKDGTQQVNSIKKTFKHIFGMKTGMFLGKNEIVGRGIGVVTKVGEDGTSIVTYKDGSTTVEDRLPLGATVFHTPSANGEATVLPLTYRNFESNQLQALSELIAFRLFTQSNTIRKGNKEFKVIGTKLERGIVDSLIILSPRENKEKQIFFKKDGSLVVGKKEFNGQSNPKEVKAALIDALIKGNNKVSFKLTSVEELILPTAIDENGNVTSDEKAESYEDILFNGETPMIGTNVHHEVPFVNAYYDLETGPKGYETNFEEAPEVDPNYTEITVPTPTTQSVITTNLQATTGIIQSPTGKWAVANGTERIWFDSLEEAREALNNSTTTNEPTETPNDVAKESVETCKITPNFKNVKFKK